MDIKKQLVLSSSGSRILKFTLKLLFLFAMALVVAGLAKTYSYFKTGAEKTDLITSTQQKSIIHDPVYSWDTNQIAEGVEMDEFTRQNIQDAYTASWYILNNSIKAQKDLGLADQFSKRMYEKIEKNFNPLTESIEERVDLEHNIKLHLFSYDRQLVSFTDSEVKLIRKIDNSKTGESYMFYDTLNFDIVMGLEDGYWKIFELVQLETGEANEKSISTTSKVAIPEKIKGINYYPSEHPWLDFWKNYDKKTVVKDLKLIDSLGFNHVRIFVPYALFGKGTLDKKMTAHLDDFLNACSKQSIGVTISLFDFPESYRIPYYPATRKHFIAMLDRYQHHPAIVIWDIKNEADLDFENYGKDVVLDWLNLIIDIAREKAPHINLTVGWSSLSSIELCEDKLDLQSFHLYRNIEVETNHLRKLKKENVIKKPLYISEFGMTSYRSKILPFGSTEKQQAIYTKSVLDLMQKEKIDHYAFWTLHDFDEAPVEIIGRKPWIRNAQEKMGMLSVQGKEKPVIKNFTDEGGYTGTTKWHEKIKPIYFILSCIFLIAILLTFKVEY